MSDHTHELWDIRFANSIIDAMAEGVFTMDADGRISSWNRSMERISGFTALEALGQTCSLLQCSRCFGTECPSGIAYCGIINLGHAEAKECLIRHKDGHDVPVIKNASVVKDVHGHVLGVVETVTDLTELNRERQRAQEAALRLGDIHRLHNIIGKSRPMRQVFTAIEAAAASEATVLIQGESGTGKELVAGAIHFNSDRKQGPLVAVNCSALTETLLESELFGHVRGAFTGAISDRAGLFREAHEGTLFLDEIGELDSLQVKLLRVLQEKEFERIGSNRTRKVDVRIISATNRNLSARAQQGRFRMDLYYRVAVIPLAIPPLRERAQDILRLAGHFIDKHQKRDRRHLKTLDLATRQRLEQYPWPGNIRELENAIEHALAMSRESEITPACLPLHLLYPESPASATADRADLAANMDLQTKRREREHRAITEALLKHEGNLGAVAEALGISRVTLWRRKKKYYQSQPASRPRPKHNAGTAS